MQYTPGRGKGGAVAAGEARGGDRRRASTGERAADGGPGGVEEGSGDRPSPRHFSVYL